MIVKLFMIILSCTLLSGCVATRSTLIDVRAPLPSTQIDAAYNAVVTVLLNAGFDLKMNDHTVHAVATEYRKFTDVSGWPPFDFYLRVKAHIRQDPGGTYELAITPTIKEQNRLNANAFTEHALVLYSETEQRDEYIVKSGRGKAMLLGQQQFLALLQTIAQRLSLTDEQLHRQINTVDLVGL
jgi:hypothetical protein